MPTDKPKLSAYIPQSVYDRFKQFQDERQLPMSQAVAVILVEYFGLTETMIGSQKRHSPCVDAVTQERVVLQHSLLGEPELMEGDAAIGASVARSRISDRLKKKNESRSGQSKE